MSNLFKILVGLETSKPANVDLEFAIHAIYIAEEYEKHGLRRAGNGYYSKTEGRHERAPPRVTSLIEDAINLIDILLPGWQWARLPDSGMTAVVYDPNRTPDIPFLFEGKGANFAIALTAAVITAYKHFEDQKKMQEALDDSIAEINKLKKAIKEAKKPPVVKDAE